MKNHYILLLLQCLLTLPLAFGYFFEVLAGTALLISAFFFLEDIKYAVITLPLVIYMPFPISYFGNIRFSEIGVAIIVILFLFTLLNYNKTHLHTPLTLPITLIIVTAILSMLNARYPVASLKNIIKLVLALVFVFWIIVNYIKTKREMFLIMNMIIIGGILASVYGIFQFIINDESTMGMERRIFGLLGGGYGAFVGTSLVISICLLLSKAYKAKLFLYFSLPVLILAMVFHQSRAWSGATLVAIIFILLKQYKKLNWTKILVLGVSVLLITYFLISSGLLGLAPKNITEFATERSFELGFTHNQNQGKFLSGVMRLMLWYKGFQLFLQNPVLGFGIGNLRFRNMFTGELGPPEQKGVGYIDNHYLNILYETGIIGALAWLILLIYIFRTSLDLLRIAKQTEFYEIALGIIGSIIVFFVGGVFWCLTVVHEMTVMVGILFGLLFACVNIINNQIGKNCTS